MHEAILNLIADLYSQVRRLQGEADALRAQLAEQQPAATPEP